jgi:hypothetical protein
MAYLVALLTCVPPTMVDFSTVSSQNHVSSTRSTSNKWQNDYVFGIKKFGPAKGVAIGVIHGPAGL